MDDPAPYTFTVAEYSELLHHEVVRRLVRTGVSPIDADDIAQDAVELFLVDPADVMARYPKPHIYASACAGSRAEDFRRRERSQRSEGARLVIDLSGEQTVARPVDALANLLPSKAPKVSGGYEVVDLLTDFRAAFARLDPCDRQLVRLVDFEGWSVTDAAAIVGLSRAHASRRHTQACAQLRAYLQEPLAC